MMDDFQFRLVYRLRNSQNVSRAQYRCVYPNSITPYSVRVCVHVRDRRNRLRVSDVTRDASKNNGRKENLNVTIL